MKTFFNKYLFGFVISASLLSSCTKDEYFNPSQASNETVVTSVNGLISIANGLQQKYSVGRTSPIYSSITASGLSTNELIVLNQGNTDEANLQGGKGNVAGNNSVVTRLWEQSLLTKANAELILNNIAITDQDLPTKNALICYASLFKGLSLLQLGTFWEQAPLTKGTGAAFSPRKAVLEEALKSFQNGSAAAPTAVISSAFIGGIDFVQTFNALQARVHNMLGDNDKAIEFASKVDITKKSEFTYDAIARNPIFDVSYSNANVCEPSDANLGLKGTFIPSADDARVLFYIKAKVFTAANDGKGFFTANEAKIPIYLPGEMLLIKAEALARKNDLDGAIVELNKVLTKATDVYTVTAKLPAYNGEKTQAAILTEIYKNRCIELYNSGLKLEDSRRFGRPNPNDAGADRTRNFYPYPTTERDNNPSTPADPAI
jgi:starch-binding outer membrane protein, SusD/RagB family